jgi:hypothetical protein
MSAVFSLRLKRNAVDEAEVQQQQAREGGQSSQLPNDLLDSSLMQRRSRVAAGSSSSYMCTNLKHMYTHGYQVFNAKCFTRRNLDVYAYHALVLFGDVYQYVFCSIGVAKSCAIISNSPRDTVVSQGTIVWERWQLQEFLQARKRVCRVSNVCWANGRLTMCASLRAILRQSAGY